MAHDDHLAGLQAAVASLATSGVALAGCGHVLAGEHCGCGQTYAETLAELAEYEAWLATQRSLTSLEAAR